MTKSCEQVARKSPAREDGACAVSRERLIPAGRRLGILALCGWMVAAACDSSSLDSPAATSGVRSSIADAGDRTMGFVLGRYEYGFYQTEGAREECPHGFAHNNRENWEAQFPTREERESHLSRCLSITHRGPNCEDVWSNPELIEDPLPFREVEGSRSYGANLDGAADGQATATTCEHETFVSPDGEPGIDNQYYRFLGCDRFVQGGQHHSEANALRRTSQYQANRVLLEIAGVDDEVNDDRVEVTLYRGLDSLVVDAAEKAVPWQSQRIDPGIPPVRLRGRIDAGVLITEPADVFWEGVAFERRLLVRGMTLRLKLASERAEGLRLGYVDVDRFWQSYAHTAKWGGSIYAASAPAAYEALRRLADGYKDPKTGKCTGLSSARKLEFVRAHLISPSQRPKP